MKLASMRALTLGLLLGAGLAASASADETLSIGMLSIMTGPGASQGIAAASGAQIAVDDVNAAGGLHIGDKVYQVKLITYDEQNKAAETLSGYDRLVNQDGVKFIIGPLSGVGTLAIKSKLNEDHVLAFSSAWSKKIFDQDSPSVFRVVSTSHELAGPLTAWLAANDTGVKKVAIVNQNDETGWDAAPVIQDAYKQAGFDVVSAELFERETTDFQPLLTKVLATNPDLIDLATSAPATAGLIVRQARDLGFTGKFMKIGGPGARDIVAAAGASAEGVDMWAMADPTNDGYKRLAQIFTDKTGNPPNDLIIPFYDATRMLLAAIEKAGTTDDTSAVAAAIPQIMPFKSVLGGDLGIGGIDTYGINNQVLRPNFIAEIKDGASVIIGNVK